MVFRLTELTICNRMVYKPCSKMTPHIKYNMHMHMQMYKIRGRRRTASCADSCSASDVSSIALRRLRDDCRLPCGFWRISRECPSASERLIYVSIAFLRLLKDKPRCPSASQSVVASETDLTWEMNNRRNNNNQKQRTTTAQTNNHKTSMERLCPETHRACGRPSLCVR